MNYITVKEKKLNDIETENNINNCDNEKMMISNNSDSNINNNNSSIIV